MARKIEVEIVGDSRSLERAFGRASSSAKKFNVSIGSLAKSAAVFGLIGSAVAGMTSLVGAGVSEWKEMATVAAQTNAVLKATGGVANVTARHVDKLAKSISAYSGEDDEAVASAANLLLTFKAVKNEVGSGNQIFDRATRSAVDLARAGFGSLSTNAKQLGKVLNDPVKGMTALNRSGITFTREQRNMIKHLAETGRLLEAQKLVLKEVESQVGGSAKAYGRTLPGQLSRLKESFRNNLGGLVQLVARPLGAALGHVNNFIDRFEKAKGVKAKFRVAITGLEDLGRRVFTLARNSLAGINWEEAVRTAQDGLLAGVRKIATVLDSINWSEVGRRLGRAIATGLDGAREFLESVKWDEIGKTIVRGISDFLQSVDWVKLAKTVINLLVAALNAAADLLIGVGEELGGQLMDGIGAGLEAAGRFVLAKLLQFVKKVLGVTGFLGRFDPFKGVRAKVQRQLDAMEGDTRSAVTNINAELGRIQDVDITVTIDTVSTFNGQRRPEEGTSALSAAQGAVRDAISRSKQAAAAKAAKAAAQARQKAAEAGAAAVAKATEAAKAAAQKAAARAKKAAEARDKAFGELSDSLALKFDRAESGGSFKQALAVLAEQERAVRAQIAAAGRTTALERELFRIQQDRKSIREQMADMVSDKAEKDLAKLQRRQFKAIGLSGEGTEIVPGLKNLRKQFASLSDRIADSPGTVSQKLVARLAGVRKALAGGFGKLKEDTRKAIAELFGAIRSEFDDEAGKLGPELKRIQISDKIAEALGFSRQDLLGGLPTARSSSARSSAATSSVASSTVVVNVNGNVVTDNPDDFLKQMQKRASRTTASSRGRFPGQSMGLA